MDHELENIQKANIIFYLYEVGRHGQKKIASMLNINKDDVAAVTQFKYDHAITKTDKNKNIELFLSNEDFKFLEKYPSENFSEYLAYKNYSME